MTPLTVPFRAAAMVAVGVAILTGLLTWNGHRSSSLDRQELAAALSAQQRSAAQAALYRRDNAVLRARLDSLSRERAKRDTVYLQARRAVQPHLVPLDSVPGDSAALAARFRALQTTCSDAINACDLYKATAEAELADRRTQAQQDSTRIEQLSTDLGAAQDKLLQVLTAEPEPLTFREKVEKVAKVTLIVLAIIGSFFLGQAAP